MIEWISNIIQWIGKALTAKLPVWLYIAVLLVCALFALHCACTAHHNRNTQQMFVGKADYDGHNFLVFRAVDGQDIHVLHDPDCICWILNDSI